MGKSVIKIDIKTISEGKEMISEATMDLKELQKIVGSFINEMSAAYATQIEGDAKLETVMGRHFSVCPKAPPRADRQIADKTENSNHLIIR